MPVWVTLKSGEVRKYNTGERFLWENGNLSIASGEPVKENAVADIRAESVLVAEFREPCEITYNADAVDKAMDILLTRAKSIADLKRKAKLADLARLLRGFNPQRKVWTR